MSVCACRCLRAKGMSSAALARPLLLVCICTNVCVYINIYTHKRTQTGILNASPQHFLVSPHLFSLPLSPLLIPLTLWILPFPPHMARKWEDVVKGIKHKVPCPSFFFAQHCNIGLRKDLPFLQSVISGHITPPMALPDAPGLRHAQILPLLRFLFPSSNLI